ncbi:DUF1566 domain-containing protein [Ulvibacter antarcticus]|uniref:Uncharacterized protein DUF1566 n=1 Tax=Ulvibacter antarcticus TaxID=442714 RepID=A0A3L9YIG2_9FLAO|nr:DUF1566 domain-containing protein [Ulvibacter antarcticus]RMA57718.1 uncharacterized protein DUF1566 [Ulvibacter antarcticus]
MKRILLILMMISISFSCDKKEDDAPTEVLTFEIGDNHEGGIIFYLDASSMHGLIASEEDQEDAVWGCLGNTTPISQDTSIGSGSDNTAAIVAACSQDNIAAKICAALSLNGYDDWFLPSSDELEQLYLHRDVVGGFDESYGSVYISSSEFFPVGTGQHLNCWVHDFGTTPVIPASRKLNSNKDNPFHIRAVRAF